LVTGKIRRDDYRGRANLPILHRKETFLPPEHPLHDKFAKLTRQEEAAGLLDDTARIGFRLNWELNRYHPTQAAPHHSRMPASSRCAAPAAVPERCLAANICGRCCGRCPLSLHSC